MLITTTDLAEVSDFFGSQADYLYIAKGQVWASDQDGNVSEVPVSFEAKNTKMAPPIDESG